MPNRKEEYVNETENYKISARTLTSRPQSYNIRCRKASRNHVTGNIVSIIADVQRFGLAKSVEQTNFREYK
jgi:hypothetical protein